MAGAAGFEPAVHGIKTRCLTAWLRPNLGYQFVGIPVCGAIVLAGLGGVKHEVDSGPKHASIGKYPVVNNESDFGIWIDRRQPTRH